MTYRAANRIYWHPRDDKGRLERPEDANYSTDQREIFSIPFRKLGATPEQLETLWRAWLGHCGARQKAGASCFDEEWAERWRATAKAILEPPVKAESFEQGGDVELVMT